MTGMAENGGIMNLYNECKVEKCVEITSLYTAFERSFDSSYFFDGETHDFWEMVYVKSGKVGVVADDKIYEISESQLVLHPPMQFHRIWSIGESQPSVIIISFGAKIKKNPVGSVFCAPKDVVCDILDGIHEVFFMGNINVSSLKEGCDEKAQIVINKLEMLILSLVGIDNVEKNADIAVNNRKYAEIVKILSDNTDKCLTVNDIATMCNMSVSNLKKIFLKYSGMGIKHYYNEMKARRAIQYLHDGYSVKEAAAMLGFADQNYFSMFFKRIMGSSPTNYIKQA